MAKPKKEKDETFLKTESNTTTNKTMKLEDIQARARCNWCRNVLNTSETITESNFVDTGKKFADGKPAFALYCNECLADSFRTSQPKAAIARDRETLDEIDVAYLLD